MAGSPPPPDASSADEQDKASVDAGFAAGPPVASLCGFTTPTFTFQFGFKIPIGAIAWPPIDLPSFSVSLGLHCDVNNPIDVSAHVGFGGGRVSSGESDPDEEEST